MKKLRFWVIGLGLVASVLYLVITGIQATGVRYVEVGELGAFADSSRVTGLKTTGKVAGGSLDYDPYKPLITFEVRGPEGRGSVRVRYEGIKPDAMSEGGHVIVEGRYDPRTNTLRAHTLLAKCPSRYKSRFKEYDASS